MAASDRRPQISVAPMMNVTDRHCRYFLRMLAPDVRLYTEMLPAQAVLRGDGAELLRFDAAERPLAVQLAGREPRDLAEAARLAEDMGYDEINLNVGCPSNRVREGRFGVSLMLEPEVVAHCVEAVRRNVTVPVSIKIRTGIDEHDSFEFLAEFIGVVAGSGCETFVIHARKALSRGLSPRQNLVVPALRYDLVYRLKATYPQLRVIINGGIRTIGEIAAHLEHVDGVMLGRKAADEPYFLTEIQRVFFGASVGSCPPKRTEVVAEMVEYARREMAGGARLHHITRHMLGLFHGVPGARDWRRYISRNACRHMARPEVLLDSLACFRRGRTGQKDRAF